MDDRGDVQQGRDSRGLLRAVVGDGTPLLVLTGVGLLFAGGFAMFLGLRGEFLPHDLRYLGIDDLR